MSGQFPNMRSNMPQDTVFARYYDPNDWIENNGPKAAEPWVPDPMDDTRQPLSDEEKEAKRLKREKLREAKIAEKKRICEEAKRLPGLLRLPAEVRIRIWHELLVTRAPILVHDGWRKVYKHQRQRQGRSTNKEASGDRHIAILSVCKTIHPEALEVLYGANTFLYRLRDATDTQAESSSLVKPSNRRVSYTSAETRPRGRGARQEAKRQHGLTEPYIRVDANVHLFRHIAVEAEHNRFSASTRTAMANAIRVFAPRPDAPSPRFAQKRKASALVHVAQPNIRTLTIRVAPRWNSHDVLEQDGNAGQSDSDEMSLLDFELPLGHGGDEHDNAHELDFNFDTQDTSVAQSGYFTFVDFFTPDSPVIEAINAVTSRFVHIELMSQYKQGSANKTGCCLTIDRYYQASAIPSKDGWKRDRQMFRQRHFKRAALVSAMQNIGESVAQFCSKHVDADVLGVAALSGWHDFHESSSDYED
ncbi:hypothetical protein CDD81_3386 [Ophiocordyceps australis]|uniref:Uncharacterized protein n=1 Tax=Ophiocordyceps australis TaxID=1399860 RepID=A0A2C5XS83_9HYPO|nr:hypothetical protein CDD81_3386 [Ophiocordyceps australis]